MGRREVSNRRIRPLVFKCPRCRGTGIEPSKEHTTRAACWECLGTGRAKWRRLFCTHSWAIDGMDAWCLRCGAHDHRGNWP